MRGDFLQKGSVMKKRLRKKLRRGEFREECFELSFDLDPALTVEQSNELIAVFVDFIEGQRLQFGGGGDSVWTGVVEAAGRRSATASDREAVLHWLRAQPQILAATAGPLLDAWHGWD